MTDHKVVIDAGVVVVRVAAGRGDDLQRLLAEFGIAAAVDPAGDRLVFAADADPRVVQAVVDRWPG
jgi:hypothetical protein